MKAVMVVRHDSLILWVTCNVMTERMYSCHVDFCSRSLWLVLMLLTNSPFFTQGPDASYSILNTSISSHSA
jgi:hypothetical protein